MLTATPDGPRNLNNTASLPSQGGCLGLASASMGAAGNLLLGTAKQGSPIWIEILCSATRGSTGAFILFTSFSACVAVRFLSVIQAYRSDSAQMFPRSQRFSGFDRCGQLRMTLTGTLHV